MKKTFLIFIGASYKGHLFQTIQAKNVEQAFELLATYLRKQDFSGVVYDADLKCVFAFVWHYNNSFVTGGKVADHQECNHIDFNIEPAQDWAI